MSKDPTKCWRAGCDNPATLRIGFKVPAFGYPWREVPHPRPTVIQAYTGILICEACRAQVEAEGLSVVPDQARDDIDANLRSISKSIVDWSRGKLHLCPVEEKGPLP